MSGFVTPVAFNPPTISQEAAFKAAAGAGKRRIPSGVINNLARKSRRMASDFREEMEKNVKRKLDSMSGPDDNRKVGLKVAQFIPGKGMEVAGAQVDRDAAIQCSLGLKGQQLVDSLDETFKTVKGRRVSMDFAFKLINDNSGLLDQVKDTRVTTFNTFRHVNPESFDNDMTGWHADVNQDGHQLVGRINSNYKWHSTLGPDAAPIRRATGGLTPLFTEAGTWRGIANEKEPVATGGLSNMDVQDVIYGYHIVKGNPYKIHAQNTNIPSDFTLVGAPSNSLGTVFTATAGGSVLNNTYGEVESLVGTPNTGDADKANSLMSPFRYPKDMEIMYSRMNRQLLENYGWTLNPFTFASFQGKADDPSGDNKYQPQLLNLQTWSDPGVEVLNYTSPPPTGGTGFTTYYDAKKASWPAQINTGNTAYSDPPVQSSFDWRSQLGAGKLAYQFQNDGTNPVCVDICVIGVKKGENVSLSLFEELAGYNYDISKLGNAGETSVNGYQTLAVDSNNNIVSSGSVDLSLGSSEWHKNAKLPFIPDACFKNPQSYLDAADFNPGPTSGSGSAAANVAREVFTYLEQGKKNPFKVVKRDQFIVSSGSTRAWNTTLPSIKYRPQLYEDVEYPLNPQNGWLQPDKVVTTADEYTFMLAIGASGLAKPVEEVYPSVKDVSVTATPSYKEVDQKAIIDRLASTVNLSVVGTYTETVKPVYPVDLTEHNFINGRLTEPYFAEAPGKFNSSVNHIPADRVNTVDIAQLSQVVVPASDGVVGVGAITTDIGA